MQQRHNRKRLNSKAANRPVSNLRSERQSNRGLAAPRMGTIVILPLLPRLKSPSRATCRTEDEFRSLTVFHT